MDNLKKLIREVPDFPKPGINFYDITTLLKDASGLKETIDALAAHYEGEQIDTVIIEHPYLGWLGWMLKMSCNIQLIVHTQNIEYERFRTLGKSWWPVLKFYESFVLRQADKVF